MPTKKCYLTFLIILTIISLGEVNLHDTKENFEENKIKFLDSKKPLRYLNTMNLTFSCKNDEIDCSGNGKCNAARNGCDCNFGYTTISNPKNFQCNYEMKHQLKAFLLELFVGFGAGHFYTLRYLMASLKLCAFLFGLYLICLFPIMAKCISEKFDSDLFVFLVSCFYYCYVIGIAFWYVWDLVMFGMNKYNDGNELPLIKWGSPYS